MGAKFGEIDIMQILENEFKISVLERIIDHILLHLPPGSLTQSDLANIRTKALEAMQQKYPNSNIQLK